MIENRTIIDDVSAGSGRTNRSVCHADRFRRINSEEKAILARAYALRCNDILNREWVDCYSDWLYATKEKPSQKGAEGMNELLAMAVYFFEHLNTTTKDTLVERGRRYIHERTRGINR